MRVMKRSATRRRRCATGGPGRVLGVSVVALLAMGLAACDVESESEESTATDSAAAEPPGTVEPADDSAVDDQAADEVESETFVMPDVTGMVLQDAQDLLQSLGSYLMDQEDASGADRMQINDSNWRVCVQDPAPGVVAPTSTMVMLASVKLDETCPGSDASESEGTIDGEDDASDTDAPEPDESDEPEMTVAQEQAVRAARNYLDFMAFSKSGLIGQLEFEGYSTADAEFAVEHVDVNWRKQAALKAQSYLDMMPFSRSGLIDQLIFEGFTRKQAEHGADAVGL